MGVKVEAYEIKIFIDEQIGLKCFKDNQIELMKEDLQYGLRLEQVRHYAKRGLDFAAMQVYSKCFRAGYPDEVIDIITMDGLQGVQMHVALEY